MFGLNNNKLVYVFKIVTDERFTEVEQNKVELAAMLTLQGWTVSTAPD